MVGLFVILAATVSEPVPLPRLVVLPGPEGACGVPAVEDVAGARRLLVGGPPGFCVHAAFAARLEDAATVHVVMRVSGTEANAAERIFIYRLDGDRLVPRYLASGPDHLRLVAVEPVTRDGPDALRIRATDAGGAATTLLCGFVGFPLLCTAAPTRTDAPAL